MTLLYSGGCPVCRWTVRHLVTHFDPHRALDILPFRHPLGRTLLAKKGLTDIDTIRQHWWFIDAEGKLWQANRGGAKQVLLAFEQTRQWARFIPSWVLDRLDDLVNKSRPFIARFIEDGPALTQVRGKQYQDWVMEWAA